MKFRVAVFSVIVILNIVVKAYYSDGPPYSYDEIISVKNTLLDFGHIKHEAEWDNNPPFFYYCLWVWHKVLPVNEFSSRLLSVIFVSLGIGIAFLFADKFFSPAIGVWSAVLLTMSNFVHYYALEARAYSLIFLLSLVSSYLFFLYLNRKQKQYLIWLSVVNFLIIYTHYVAGIILLFQYVLFWFYGREYRKSFYLTQSLVVIALVMLRFTKGQFLHIIGFNQTGDFWLQKATFSDLANAAATLLFHPVVALIIIMFHIIYLALSLKKDRVLEQRDLYVMSVGFGSLIILFLIGTLKPIFLARYLIFAISFFTIFFVHKVLEFRLWGNVALSLLSAFLIFRIDLVKEAAMDYRSVAGIVSAIKQKDDLVLINTRDNQGLFLYYYDRSAFLADPMADSACAANGIYGVNTVNEANEIKWTPGAKLFLVQSFHMLTDTENVVRQKIAESGRELFSTTRFNGVEFSVFVKRN